MTHERTNEIEQLYNRNREQIRDAALEKPNLLIQDADRIADNLAQYLPFYDGPPDDIAFVAWASEIAKLSAERICRLRDIFEKHKATILRGIRSALPGRKYFKSRSDRQALIEDSFQELSLYIFAHLDDLDPPGQPDDELAARLCALARTHTLGYHTLKLKRRKDALERHILAGGAILECEVLSEAEIAEMRSAEDGEYHAPVDLRKAIGASRLAAAQDDRRSSDLGRMLCPSGCGIEPVITLLNDGKSQLACGHVRSSQMAAAV